MFDAHQAWQRSGRMRFRFAAQADPVAPHVAYAWTEPLKGSRYVVEIDAELVCELEVLRVRMCRALDPIVQVHEGVFPRVEVADDGDTLLVARLASFNNLEGVPITHRCAERLAIEWGCRRMVLGAVADLPDVPIPYGIQQAQYGALDAGALSIACRAWCRPRVWDATSHLVLCEWENPTRM